MKAKLYDISEGMNGLIVSFKVERGAEVARLRSMPDEELELTVKKHKERRSLNANAYMWTLIDKIAQAVGSDREELYIRYIRQYGIFCDVTLTSSRAQTIRTGWERQGIGWHTETICDNGETINVRLYYGSSVYSKEQMSRVIQAVIDDANDLGIETRTPEEIDSMIKAWKGYEQTHKINEHTV